MKLGRRLFQPGEGPSRQGPTGAFSMIVKTDCETDGSFYSTSCRWTAPETGRPSPSPWVARRSSRAGSGASPACPWASAPSSPSPVSSATATRAAGPSPAVPRSSSTWSFWGFNNLYHRQSREAAISRSP